LKTLDLQGFQVIENDFANHLQLSSGLPKVRPLQDGTGKIMAEKLREARKRPVLTAPNQPVRASGKPPVRRIDVHDLMAGGREAVLLHDSEEYRLP
jgi:hypothetical protein